MTCYFRGASAVRRHNYIKANFQKPPVNPVMQELWSFHCQGGSNKPHTFVTESVNPACFVFLFNILPSPGFFWNALICFACLWGENHHGFSVRTVFGNKICLSAAVSWMQRILVNWPAGSVGFSVSSVSVHTRAFSRKLQLLLDTEHPSVASHHPTRGLKSCSVIDSPS